MTESIQLPAPSRAGSRPFGRLSHAQMYSRLLASDPTYDGAFFTGVLTTGIYCLPSCRARKPRSENVRFFPTPEAARAAGLRACQKCHPDDFARGADPVLEDTEHLVAEIRSQPGAFADARAIVRRSGFGATRLFELFRQHYHTTPAEVLLESRMRLAQDRLLHSNDGLLEVAQTSGFETPSVFHKHIRERTGLTPTEYRALRNGGAFTIALPQGYSLPYLKRALSRDIHSVTERLAGNIYTTIARFEAGPARVRLELSATAVRVTAEPITGVRSKKAAPNAVEAHAFASRLLGLDQPAAAFSRLARKLGFHRLVEGRPGLRISQTPSIFDGLLWSIIGQQINFPFACQLRRRLVERAGTKLEDGLHLFPTPADVAALDPAELLPLQFSRQKAAYLIDAARLVADGSLDLDALAAMSATRAERTLLAIRGLGPWSVNYVLMRSLGFADCVPLGDTGVTSGLQALLELEIRPDVDATRRLMRVFSPYRSFATAHLWQFNQPIPT